MKNYKITNIDEYQINGDFLESQAFGYLAIRSKLNYLYHFQIQQDVKKLLLEELLRKIFNFFALNIRQSLF